MPVLIQYLYDNVNGAQEIELPDDYSWARLEIDVLGGTPNGTFSLEARIDEDGNWKPQAFIPISETGAGDFITQLTSFTDAAYNIPLRGARQLRAVYAPTTGTLQARIALTKAGY
ncbi:MAG: hypothetical protein D6712_18795 [Chloroflexi bacterium]|nr:MAG: hypothetical protein D6712_18795 [Chloroflexota bacterium]